MKERFLLSYSSIKALIGSLWGRRRYNVLGSICAILFLNGCSELYVIDFNSQKEISGQATMFNEQGTLSLSKQGSLSLSCNSATVSLHALEEGGSIGSETLASSSIERDGSYTLNISDKKFDFQKNVSYVVKATGCGSDYCRPLTDYKQQTISGVTSLVCLANGSTSNSKKPLSQIPIADLKSIMDGSLKSATASTLEDLLQIVAADSTLSSTYQELTGVPPLALRELPPTSFNMTAPLSIHEGTTNTYSVTINHWNSQYKAAYQWKLNGVVVSSTASYLFSPGKNSQGDYNLTLVVGSQNSQGALDLASPIKSESVHIAVSNDYPAIVPELTLISPSTSSLPLGTRALTLGISTGLGKNHCETFSSLALTENSATAPSPHSFNIECSSEGVQSLSYNLISSGDGKKVLRLWTKDAGGNISTTPSVLNIQLDTAPPMVNITSSLNALSNATSQSFSFSAQDNGGEIDHFECRLNSGNFESCSSPKAYSGLTQGAQNFTVRAVDTAGNTSTPVTANWVIDLTKPTLSLSSVPPSITQNLSSTFAFSGNDTGGGTIARFECKIDAGPYSTCLSPFVQILSAGSHSFSLRASDTAGNVSEISTHAWTIDTSAPTVNLSSHPPSLTNSTSASFSFNGFDTGGGSVSSFQCSLNASSFSACTSPKIFSGLGAGVNSFSVRAIDTAGNVGGATTYSWTIDLTTPMASITTKPDIITNETSATFEFSATPPPSGSITGYQCSLDGSAYAPCSSPKTYSGLIQGSHSFSVKSVDNNSALSAAVTESWTIDTTAPVITISSAPANYVDAGTATVTFSATESGGGTVSKYECKVDLDSYSTCVSPFSKSGLAEGVHSFSVRAIDTAGNVSSVASSSWSIDISGPTLTVSSSPNSITNQQTAPFTFSAVDSGAGVHGYECSFDSSSFASCTSPLTYSGLSAGAHNLQIRALDSVGNVSSIISHSWTIDLSPPIVSITGNPNLNSNSTSATISFGGSDSGGGVIATYQCSLDSASFTPCSSPKSVTGLTQGGHSLSVRAVDTAGNVGSSETFAWNVDTIAPATTITTPSTNGSVVPRTSLSSFSVGGACENNLNVVLTGIVSRTVSCSANTWTTSLDLSSAADGSLSVSATQVDASGNSTSVSRNFIKDSTNPVINLTNTPSAAQKGGTSFAVGFSVTESNISTAQSFSVQYSINDGSSWVTAGTISSSNGPLANNNFVYNLTLPTVDSSQVKIKVQGTDMAGNVGSSAASASFMIDSTGPSISSFTINDSSTSSSSTNNNLSLTLNSSDTLSEITAYCLQYNSNTTPSLENSCWTSLLTQGVNPGLSIQIALANNIYFRIGYASGLYNIYLWTRDSLGNISAVSGPVAVNYSAPAPPAIEFLSVANSDTADLPPTNSQSQIPQGQGLYVKWRVPTSVATLSLEYSSNLTDWHELASGLNNGINNSCTLTNSATGCIFLSSASPLSSYYLVRLKATSSDNSSSYTSGNPINPGKFQILLGNTSETIGASASAAVFMTSDVGDPRLGSIMNLVSTPDGRFFIADPYRGLLVINPADGLLTKFIPQTGSSSGDGGPASSATIKQISKIAVDSAGNLLVWDYNRIRKVTLSSSPATISTIIGGGETTDDNVAIATNLKINVTDANRRRTFFPLPDGRLIFESEDVGEIRGKVKRYRIWSPTTGISSLKTQGNYTVGSYSVLYEDCYKGSIVPIVKNNALSGFLSQYYQNGSGACAPSYHLLLTNDVNLTPLNHSIPSHGSTAIASSMVLGKDLNIYHFSREEKASASVSRYSPITETWTSVAGNGQVGLCEDDTPIMSCPMQLDDIFVTATGKMYFLDNGLIRTVTDDGKIKTLFGKSGQNTLIAGKSPSTIISTSLAGLSTWSPDNGVTTVITFYDNIANKIMEFSPGGLLSHVAGNGIQKGPSLSLPATETSMSLLRGNTRHKRITVNPNNGDVFLSQSSGDTPYLLTRSTGKWSEFFNSSGTLYSSADGLARTSIKGLHQGESNFGPFGIANGKVLFGHLNKNPSTNIQIDSMIKAYDLTTGVQEHVVGISGNTASTACADNTLLSSCAIPSTSKESTRLLYDSTWDSYIYSEIDWGSLRKVPRNPSGAIQNLYNFGTAVTALTGYRNGSEYIVYACLKGGSLVKWTSVTNTAEPVNFPNSSYTCRPHALEYIASRNSLFVGFSQNGLNGIGEYLLDP